ncbi:Membrane-bound lytic murein transglycosylase D precursor [Chitinispirillum alkaliphilum]|nr:Membrane-bound lytic murein transglycosylase D precursor [Chitinispirillum alkaliphilum]
MLSSSVSQFENSTPNSPERIKAVAREFEAMFTSIMFRAMRETVGDNPLVPSSMGEKIYTEMLDQEYASMTSKHASLGLAEMLYKEMMNQQDSHPPPSSAVVNSFKVPLWAKEHSAERITNPEISIQKAEVSTNSKALLSRINKWNELIEDKSREHGVDPHLVRAVLARESSGNPYAVSRAGAKGLMQLMDGTARDLGVRDSFCPEQNVDGGVRYLRQMLNMFNGDEKLALASYNAGPGNVRRYKGIPPFRETQHYVKAVLSLRDDSIRLAQNRSR